MYSNFMIALELAKNSLKIKYRRNVLGIAWSFLNPLFTIAVISLMFSVLMGMKYSDFFLIFFPAYLAWSFFSSIINTAMSSLVQNESLIKKVPINCIVFPMSALLIAIFEFVVSLLLFILLAFMFTNISFSLNIFYVFFGVLFLSLFAFGIALMLSIATTKWTDLTHIVSMILQVAFYISPVLYTKDFIAGKLPFVDLLLTINPLVYYLEMFRVPLSYGNEVVFKDFLVCFLMSFFSFLIGLYLFNKGKINIAVRM